jgi:3-phenylpropionate/trans-cinnamate dioxygenase ferredoxin subunit
MAGLRTIDEPAARELTAFDVGGERIVVERVGGDYYAFGDTCTHLGCSLAEGTLEGERVTCPCHGSKFDVISGAVRRGPAQEPVRSYSLRVQNGALQLAP